MVDCNIWEKIWLNLSFCAWIAGTKNATVICQREKRSLYDTFTFPSKYINKSQYFQNMKMLAEDVNMFNIPFN